ncbi:hypothetical protein C882_0657 [Caenispirillum salinarum AK4]|uniref:Uncharacterized protein n=1 Tax=Caenispirillum salinarum AK4 TaxID=1238182 RepID=K9GVW2_9PROT|nr:hypothetical protein C882_0657 [Caenispirillum salinarum AK4]
MEVIKAELLETAEAAGQILHPRAGDAGEPAPIPPSPAP